MKTLLEKYAYVTVPGDGRKQTPTKLRDSFTFAGQKPDYYVESADGTVIVEVYPMYKYSIAPAWWVAVWTNKFMELPHDEKNGHIYEYKPTHVFCETYQRDMDQLSAVIPLLLDAQNWIERERQRIERLVKRKAKRLRNKSIDKNTD